MSLEALSKKTIMWSMRPTHTMQGVHTGYCLIVRMGPGVAMEFRGPDFDRVVADALQWVKNPDPPRANQYRPTPKTGTSSGMKDAKLRPRKLKKVR